jgi:hypothetical protein
VEDLRVVYYESTGICLVDIWIEILGFNGGKKRKSIFTHGAEFTAKISFSLFLSRQRVTAVRTVAQASSDPYLWVGREYRSFG